MNESKDIYSAWSIFIENQQIDPNLNPLVASSWMRCRGRLNPITRALPKKLTVDNLLTAQVTIFDLISISRPIMEDLYQYIERSDTVIVLTNHAGCILDILGDIEMLKMLEAHGIVNGVFVSENQMGTSSIAIALHERVPCRVVGAEHYLEKYHDLADAAAPIFDITGKLLGVLGVFTQFAFRHPHTLSLVVGGARAIENQLQTDYLLREQNNQLAQLNVILAANSDGILMWDEDAIMRHANQAAAEILGLPLSSIVGRKYNEFLSFTDLIHQAILSKESISDIETVIQVENRSISSVVNLRYVDQNLSNQKFILIIRREKEVLKLVQQQVGANAPLSLDDLPGNSSQINRVKKLVKVVAPSLACVLIRGETGTGKNLVANAIHNESTRRNGPFLVFGCTAIPGELIVSELLGYDESILSKKPGGRPSKFELAKGGTLFLQNIDALPLEAQAILLNALELGITQRLGSERPIPIDVRILASTSAPIERYVSQGQLRADLYYRLSSYEITLPPLRDRTDDIPYITDRILTRFSRQFKRQLTLGPGVIQALQKYAWPGNIRELESVIARAVIQAGVSEVIDLLHLPESIKAPKRQSGQGAGSQKIKSLEEVEREVFQNTALACHGNVTEMARHLGISRTTVWRKSKFYNLSLDDYRN